MVLTVIDVNVLDAMWNRVRLRSDEKVMGRRFNLLSSYKNSSLFPFHQPFTPAVAAYEYFIDRVSGRRCVAQLPRIVTQWIEVYAMQHANVFRAFLGLTADF
jgi:hypothetical protein